MNTGGIGGFIAPGQPRSMPSQTLEEMFAAGHEKGKASPEAMAAFRDEVASWIKSGRASRQDVARVAESRAPWILDSIDGDAGIAP